MAGAFVEAARELGFAPCADHNNPTLTGVGAHPMNKVRGIRMSAARCYLTPEVRARDNLRIVANVLVRRILFENRRVVGVEVSVAGKVTRFDTSRVLLCAGAIASPGILLRSGIGAERTLNRLNVEMVSEVPAVAARLLDHPGSAMLLAPKPGVCKLNHPSCKACCATRRRTAATRRYAAAAGFSAPADAHRAAVVT